MPDRTFQFGAFEVHERSGELRKHGVKIRVQEQPFQILVLLLEHPNEIVGREEIRAKLWPDNTFVDFDNAISSSVRKLREALSDSADNPRFIETLARRGYRFIGPIAPPPPPSPTPVPKRTRTKALATAAAALLILGAVIWWLRSRPQPDAPQLMPVPLTAATGREQLASFSPDGNQIVYAWSEPGKGGVSHIYVKVIGSGKAAQLTTGSLADSFPAWSPDGRRIAFVRSLDQSKAIYWTSPIGGTERKVAEGHFETRINWSPDGRFLAASDRTSASESPSLYLVNVENGEKTPLTTPPDPKTVDRDPVFSPGGRTLLFVRCHEIATCGLYLLDLSPSYRSISHARPLREEAGLIDGAAWTADAKQVVYALSTVNTLNFQLMRLRIATPAARERLVYAGERADTPAIASPGNRLAYSQRFDDVDIWQFQPGKPAQTFASSTRLEGLPQYSPDGERVVFCSDRSGVMAIWAAAADGGNPAQLTNFPEHSCSPRWSPDGQWIAFDRRMKEGRRIFVIASDGGQPRQLTSDPGDEAIPSWSADAKWIYYASNRTGRFEIWKAPAQGGNGIQVTRHGGWTALESHDGQSLYYTKNLDGFEHPSSLWALSVHGGEERLVLESVCCRAFTVMEDGIYYLPPRAASQNASLRFLNFATRQNGEIASIEENVGRGLTVSPDRTTFLFELNTQTGSNVMIVDNFR